MVKVTDTSGRVHTFERGVRWSEGQNFIAVSDEYGKRIAAFGVAQVFKIEGIDGDAETAPAECGGLADCERPACMGCVGDFAHGESAKL